MYSTDLVVYYINNCKYFEMNSVFARVLIYINYILVVFIVGNHRIQNITIYN